MHIIIFGIGTTAILSTRQDDVNYHTCKVSYASHLPESNHKLHRKVWEASSETQ